MRVAPGVISVVLLLLAGVAAAKDEAPSLSIDADANAAGLVRTSQRHLWLDGKTSGTSIELKIEGTRLAVRPGKAADGACLWRIEGPELDDVDETRLAQELQRVLGARLKGSPQVAYPWVRAHTTPDGWIGAMRLMSAPRVSVEFRIEVRPDEELKRHASIDGRKPPRLGLWKGDAESFEIFKTVEVGRWKMANAIGRGFYRPSEPRYRLVKKHGTSGDFPSDFAVLEIGEGWFPDHHILKDPVVARSAHANRPVLNFGIRSEYQNQFAAFTKRNVGLPLAIVLDGELHSAPWINMPLDTSVQISLGAGGSDDLQRQAKRLATALQALGMSGPTLRLAGALRAEPTGALELILPVKRHEVSIVTSSDSGVSQVMLRLEPDAAATDSDERRLRSSVLASELHMAPPPADDQKPAIATAKAMMDRMTAPELAKSYLRHLARLAFSASEWTDLVLHAARHAQESVRDATRLATRVRSLPSSALPTLAALVRERPIPVAETLVEAIEPPPQVADVKALADDVHPRVRQLAAFSLSHRSGKGAFDLAAKLARDPDDAVAKTALGALVALSGSEPKRKGEVVDAVVHALERGVDTFYFTTLGNFYGAAFVIDHVEKRLLERRGPIEPLCTVAVWTLMNHPKARRPLAPAVQTLLRETVPPKPEGRLIIATILRLTNKGDEEALGSILDLTKGDSQLARRALLTIAQSATHGQLPEGAEVTARTRMVLQHDLKYQEGMKRDAATLALFKLGSDDASVLQRTKRIAADESHELAALARLFQEERK